MKRTGVRPAPWPPVKLPPAPKKERRGLIRGLAIIVALALITAFAMIWGTRETSEPRVTNSPSVEPSVEPSVVTPPTTPTTPPTEPVVQKGPDVGFLWEGKRGHLGVLLPRFCNTTGPTNCYAVLSGDYLKAWQVKPGEEIEINGEMVRPWFISFKMGRNPETGERAVITFLWDDGWGVVSYWRMTSRYLAHDPTDPNTGGYGEGKDVPPEEVLGLLERGRRYPLWVPVDLGPGWDRFHEGLLDYDLALVQALQGEAPPPSGFGWLSVVHVPLPGRLLADGTLEPGSSG